MPLRTRPRAARPSGTPARTRPGASRLSGKTPRTAAPPGTSSPGEPAPTSTSGTPAAPGALLQALKHGGPHTIRALAAELRIGYEAVRLRIAELLAAGWIVHADTRVAHGKSGPPAHQYTLSAAAEHLFPKHYDALSAELLQHVKEQHGPGGVLAILERMSDARVRHWAPRLQSLGLKAKLEALCALYAQDDPYMEVEWRDGAPALIERNCPFLEVAKAHPAICSVSVNTLERLLGFQVVREQRFQAGHGRCVFRVRLDAPRIKGEPFALEP